MDAHKEAEKRFAYGDDGDDAWGIIAAERDAFLAGAVWVLREFGDMLDAVPDYKPTDYDRGRVDQRYMNAAEAHHIADGIDEDHEHDGGCDTLDLLDEVERLRAAVDAVRALADRDDLTYVRLDDRYGVALRSRKAVADMIHATLDEHLGVTDD